MSSQGWLPRPRTSVLRRELLEGPARVSKYGAMPGALVRLQMVSDYLPSAVGQKIKYTNISRHEKSRQLRSSLAILTLARRM